MNKRTGIITLAVAVAVFAAFIGLASFAYRALGDRVRPQSGLDAVQSAPGSPEAWATDGKKAAPDFTVLDKDGNEVRLSDFRGKPVVLNFWASWCPPCKGEMPEFNDVYGQVGQDVTFVMVDLVDGQRETKETGAQFVKDQGLSFPVYFDVTGDAATAYGITAIPTTVFIDRDGNIVTSSQGALDAAELQQGIERIR